MSIKALQLTIFPLLRNGKTATELCVGRPNMRTFPGPPNDQFKPLTHQFDDGFGIADAFNEAALRLERFSEQERFINSSLPIAYLYAMPLSFTLNLSSLCCIGICKYLSDRTQRSVPL